MAIESADLWTLLGYPDGPVTAHDFRLAGSEVAGNIITEDIRLDTATGVVPGTVMRPDGAGPFPAVLYCHAHGARYDIGRSELAHGRPALLAPPYGRLLAEAGYLVACFDMAGFGERQAEGTEGMLAKAALWRGRTLFGQMLAELSAALEYLAVRADVDAGRIATFGISMGATHAYWLAALDARVAATAHLCAFANIDGLIAAEQHDLHGIYMTVPGLLIHCDMGDVAALVAPRPQLVGAGGTDPLTPPQALDPALARLRNVYHRAGADDRLTSIVSPETGHAETPEMRRAVLDFLSETIGQDPSGRMSL